ncbi:MAG: hypothetical protein ABIP71_02320 [Verrucomicrobiota bacterium]
MVGFPEISKDNWKGGIDYAAVKGGTEKTLRVNEPFVVAPVKTQSAKEAFPLVLAQAGCSLVRDSVDKRITEEIRTGTATYGEHYRGGKKGIIDSQKDVGGWPELHSKPAPRDSDHDGMPDDWEKKNRLNRNEPADGAVLTKSGYTNLENYLNSLVPNSLQPSAKQLEPEHLLLRQSLTK